MGESSNLKQQPSNKRRIVATIAAVMWALVIFGASSIPSSGLPSNLGALSYVAHFCEYFILGVLITLAVDTPRRPLWKTALIALVIASAYGATDEFHQMFVEGRTTDVLDWLTDTVGALLGSVATIWVISARKVKASRQKDAETRGERR